MRSYSGMSNREIEMAHLLEDLFTDFLTQGRFDGDSYAKHFRARVTSVLNDPCGISTIGADDIIQPCELPRGHSGYCDTRR